MLYDLGRHWRAGGSHKVIVMDTLIAAEIAQELRKRIWPRPKRALVLHAPVRIRTIRSMPVLNDTRSETPADVHCSSRLRRAHCSANFQPGRLATACEA